MKKLHFLYRMELSLSQPVAEHSFVLRFIPESDSVQKITVEESLVNPPGMTVEQTDGFGNRMLMGSIRAPHDSFSYEVRGIAEVDQQSRRKEELNPVFRYEGPLTKADAGLRQLYGQICPLEGEALSRAVCMMHSVYQNFQYVPGITNVETTASEAWKQGSGVCQDYAHLLLVLCRLNGIPARYVAGMMIGEGASHAWVEVYADGQWTALDPTNDCMVNDNYIKICHGRDYHDCAVDRGVFRGNALQIQNVYVKVEETW